MYAEFLSDPEVAHAIVSDYLSKVQIETRYHITLIHPLITQMRETAFGTHIVEQFERDIINYFEFHQHTYQELLYRINNYQPQFLPIIREIVKSNVHKPTTIEEPNTTVEVAPYCDDYITYIYQSTAPAIRVDAGTLHSITKRGTIHGRISAVDISSSKKNPPLPNPCTDLYVITLTPSKIPKKDGVYILTPDDLITLITG